MKRRIYSRPFASIVLLVAAIVFSAVFYFLQNKDLGQEDREISTVSINGMLIEVELARIPAEWEQGLSGRSHLPAGSGMLFVFEQPGMYSFWMKDMQFPIDIIWFGENHEIVDITKNLQPGSFPQTFSPQVPAQYILEVNAGFADANSINIGQIAEF
ncbi:MAG: hypothetical protein A2919_02125 [Candidatus Spechtbacteria bacterium RIFCSPLOWO2_01_FULL_43_12]|uniref:DUF192 domain-containing protein n=1 Tax=Candidatus Spechtbacteria bacterium RIFCSPLOWO2_01_FULL_43_12 TaxID=1802162 RepID=A0A1G2HDW2_9BACT|nr:MAG: hypothetical protein A2919_02125 [Candidatus Spechtbacteria bacterium RIFCSPLOWO2_01_FULL_43_12]